ncbi:MAG: tannase/feruloyl esterase family alpha/beta hydrolase [Rhizomicrobium sp.]
MLRKVFLLFLPGLLFALSPLPAFADSCSDLSSVQIQGATVTGAISVPAGQFTTPDQIGYGSQTYTVPAFCRVQLTIGTATSEVWLPAAWNGKLAGMGNGGELGAIIYGELYYTVATGYAGVSSDLGHQSYGGDASWALNRPDLITEFGYTATHDMTTAAKALIQAFYGTAPTYSYFFGSSAGGRQALMEAQRYPTDYDGIASLSPGLGWTHLMSGMIAEELKLGGSGSSALQLTDQQAMRLNRAVVAACDGLDGLKDGIITDPTKCHFDPGQLQCASHFLANCLDPDQVAAVRALYEPLRFSSGKLIYAGLPYGSEYEWYCSVLHDAFNAPVSISWYQNEVYSNPNWDFHTFNPDVDVPYADSLWASTLNASSPNLDAFKAAGGKLLMAQGQSDAIVVPQNTIDYYRNVKRRYSADTEAFARLFMEPGYGHCGPPPGPSAWDPIVAIAGWVETGVAPDSIIASKTNGDGSVTSRPLCPLSAAGALQGAWRCERRRNFRCKK